MTRNEHLLIVLAEECSEVIKDVSKALRFGLDKFEPDQSFSNRERIEIELADLMGAIELLQDAGVIGQVSESRIVTKKRKVEAMLEVSQIEVQS